MYLFLLSRLSVYVHKTADVAQSLYSRADNRKLSHSVVDIASEYRYKELQLYNKLAIKKQCFLEVFLTFPLSSVAA